MFQVSLTVYFLAHKSYLLTSETVMVYPLNLIQIIIKSNPVSSLLDLLCFGTMPDRDVHITMVILRSCREGIVTFLMGDVCRAKEIVHPPICVVSYAVFYDLTFLYNNL